MPIKVDRFGEMARAIRDSVEQGRLQNLAVSIVQQQQDVASDHLFDLSPEAIPGVTLMTTGHQHIGIKWGWRKRLPRTTESGAEATIANLSEHIDVQRYGTEKRDYQIPADVGTVVSVSGDTRRIPPPWGVTFWLGPPLKWPVSRARLRKPGFVTMREITHPGFGPWGGSDFVERAADEARPAMTEVFHRRGFYSVFAPLRTMFGE